MRSKEQLLKTASTLKTFSTKIKQAQDGLPGLGNGMGETLTPEAVQDIAQEIQQVAEVASELATEIAEGVPAEESSPLEESRGEEESNGPIQLETAQDGEEDDEKEKLKEQVANLTNDLNGIKREAKLEKLATKYASLFHKSQREAKMNEILTAKDDMPVIEARVQTASEIMQSKTMVKVASLGDGIFDLDTADGGEIDISSKL